MSRPKIAIFTRNGVIGNIAINKAIPKIIGLGYEPVLINTGEPYNKKADIEELRQIGFLETSLLRDILVPFSKQHGSLTQRGKPIPNLCYTNEEIAALYNLEYEDVPNINDSSFVNRVRADKGFVGAYSIRSYQIFHEDLISAFEERPNGFVWNMHTGLLPKYKGVHIPYHAIEQGEKIYGWTLHRVFRGIDTGNIIDIDWLPLNPKASVLSSYLNMVPKGTQMLATNLAIYKKFGRVNESPQPAKTQLSYFTFPTSNQMKNHLSNGIIFADEEEIISTYLSNYSLPGTPHYNLMEDVLRGALSTNYETASSIQRSVKN